MNVSDVMTRAVDVIHPDSTLDEAAERMRRLDVGPLPVCDGDRLVGIVSLGDLAVETADDKLKGQVLEEISRPSDPER